LIPFDRYVWRLQCLEEAIINNHGTTEGIEISAYYENEELDGSDEDLILYQGQLDEYAQRDHQYNDENLNGCGYGSIRIRWPDQNQSDTLSPWEVNVERPKSKNYCLSRHCLDEDEKERARQALKNLQRIPSVREQLMKPVDERRYVDYSFRVEVPMYLDLVMARLENNYYSSRWSIVSDVKLIRDNCIKYNGEVGLLQDEARQMYEEFEKAMLDAAERELVDLKAMILTSPARTPRTSRSSLENLPAPNAEGANPRRSLRIRIDSSQMQAVVATHGRSTRSNSQAVAAAAPVAHSDSFANALLSSSRRRQSRRQSSASESLAHETRPQRNRRAPQPAVAAQAEAPARRSTQAHLLLLEDVRSVL
jgi:Bromodomain